MLIAIKVFPELAARGETPSFPNKTKKGVGVLWGSFGKTTNLRVNEGLAF